jgi:cytochrome c oxidase subunit IV
MDFHDDYPEYEKMSNHSEEEGKPIRKKLWMVFWIMLGVTILELIIGTYASSLGLLDSERRSSTILKIIFVGLTIVKAGYIVMIFMHLGHEVKFMKWSILAPYIVFICYLIFIVIVEGSYVGIPSNRTPPHQQYLDNRKAIVNELNSGHGHSSGAETEKSGTKH